MGSTEKGGTVSPKILQKLSEFRVILREFLGKSPYPVFEYKTKSG